MRKVSKKWFSYMKYYHLAFIGLNAYEILMKGGK